MVDPGILFAGSKREWSFCYPKPAMWQPVLNFGPSLFGTEEEALRELWADPKAKGWTIGSDECRFYDS